MDEYKDPLLIRLQEKLDAALKSETKESLEAWLKNKVKNPDTLDKNLCIINHKQNKGVS